MLLVTLFAASSLIFSILSISMSSQIFAQVSPPPASNNGSNSSMGLNPPDVVKKLESVSSLTNVVGISMVEGIKLSGILIGDSDISVTLKSQTVQNSLGNKTLPVTVIVTKLPVANLTQLMSLVESSRSVATASSGGGSMDSMLGQTDLNSVMGNNAIRLLDIIKEMQIGAASIVSGNWTEPQTVSMGMLGSLRSPSTPLVPNEFITVIVIPFLESPFASISLN
jgi:hypothetical protein